MKVTARSVLDEVDKIIQTGEFGSSFSRGKNFYRPRSLPFLLKNFVAGRSMNKSAAAKFFNFSTRSLDNIFSGFDVSENMLFRLKVALERDIQQPSRSKKKKIFPGNWRSASTKRIQAEISAVSEKLIFLKRVIRESNSLGLKNAPIEEVQVAQLIALLETTLAALKAPLIETSRAWGFFGWLRNVMKKAAERGIEKRISQAADDAIKAGEDLIRKLLDRPGGDDLGGLM